MKPSWPSIALAIATSSPLCLAQAPATAPAGTAPAPSGTAPAPANPGAPTPTAEAPQAEPASPAPSEDAAAPAAAEPAPAAPAPAPASDLFPKSAPQPPAAEPVTQAAPTPPPPARPPSSNRGHLRLGARAGLVAPFGWVAQGTPQLEVTGMGAGYGFDLSFGIAEEVTLGAYGDLLVLDRVPDCTECAPLSYGLGLTVRYHLVQGLRFDPWASYGIGAIGLGSIAPDGEGSYLGIEWMRLTFGGDWYALRNLGLGPYMELGAGSFWQAPEGEDAGGVHFRFQMGMRIVLDFPGR